MAREHGERLALLVLCACVNAEGNTHTPSHTSVEAEAYNAWLLFLFLGFVLLFGGCGWWGYSRRVIYVMPDGKPYEAP